MNSESALAHRHSYRFVRLAATVDGDQGDFVLVSVKGVTAGATVQEKRVVPIGAESNEPPVGVRGEVRLGFLLVPVLGMVLEQTVPS